MTSKEKMLTILAKASSMRANLISRYNDGILDEVESAGDDEVLLKDISSKYGFKYYGSTCNSELMDMLMINSIINGRIAEVARKNVTYRYIGDKCDYNEICYSLTHHYRRSKFSAFISMYDPYFEILGFYVSVSDKYQIDVNVLPIGNKIRSNSKVPMQCIFSISEADLSNELPVIEATDRKARADIRVHMKDEIRLRNLIMNAVNKIASDLAEWASQITVPETDCQIIVTGYPAWMSVGM